MSLSWKSTLDEDGEDMDMLVRIWLPDRGVDQATHLISVRPACDKLLSRQQVLPSGSPFKVSLITTCVCLCVGGGGPSSPPLLNLVPRKIIMMNLSVIIHLALANQLIQAEVPIEILRSHSRILFLFKDHMSGKRHKRWGTHGAALWGLSASGEGGGQNIPSGQFHSNNEVFKALVAAATGNFDGRPLPPSVGRRYYDPK